MKPKFNIIQINDGEEEQSSISHKISEYFEIFIEKNILIPNKIIINSSWSYRIGIKYDYNSNSTNWPQKVINTNLKAYDGVVLIPPTTIKSDHLKSFTLIISHRRIMLSDNKTRTYAELIFQGLKLFFLNYFKKIKEDNFNKLESMIDFDYLNSLPFPVDFDEKIVQ